MRRIGQLSIARPTLPLAFEPNAGQAPDDAAFIARGRRGTMLFTPSGAMLAVHGHVHNDDTRRRDAVLRLQFLGSEGAAPVPADPKRSTVSYFVGNDPAKWHTKLPTYGRLEYRDIYPGVTAAFYGDQRQLEYDMIAAPGADPRNITLGFRGATRVAVSSRGDLIVHTPVGLLRQRRPYAYQERDGVRQRVDSRYILKGKRRVGFELGEYDRERPLIIDPVLAYSTYLGNSTLNTYNEAWAVAVDASGAAYVVGNTSDREFPTTNPINGGVQYGNVFVMKFDSTGGVIYSVVLGNNGSDKGYAIAVDSNGAAWIAGVADGGFGFPTTPNAFRTTCALFGDAYVAKISPDGSALVYSTCFGGTFSAANGIAVDGDGAAYVTGTTSYNGLFGSLPTTPGVYSAAPCDGCEAVFAAKIDPRFVDAAHHELVYSTYIGGGVGTGIAVDATGAAYVTGSTLYFLPFPTTPGAFQSGPASGAFVAKLNPTGSALVYSTLVGGFYGGAGSGIAVDNAGNAYIAGSTNGNYNFPVTPGTLPAAQFTRNAFITKLNPTGTGLVYSTLYGGTGGEAVRAIDIDDAGNAYVTGVTLSIDLPTTPDAVQFITPCPGQHCSDAFFAKVNATGTALLYSTYLGGSAAEQGNGVAHDPVHDATYVVGSTVSTDFPTTPDAIQPTYQQNSANNMTSAFVSRIAPYKSPIEPSHGGDTGTVTIVIHASGLSSGAGARLTRTGEADIVPLSLDIDADGSVMRAMFDLTGRTRGAWDVVVSNPGTPTIAYADAFVIEEGREAKIQVNILGMSIVGANRPNRFTISVSNAGNTNAYSVPVVIAGIPTNATWEIGITVDPVPPPPGVPPVGLSPGLTVERDAERFVCPDSGGACATETVHVQEIVIPLVVGTLRPGATLDIPLTLTVPIPPNTFTLQASAGPSLVDTLASASGMSSLGAENAERSGGGASCSVSSQGPVCVVEHARQMVLCEGELARKLATSSGGPCAGIIMAGLQALDSSCSNHDNISDLVSRLAHAVAANALSAASCGLLAGIYISPEQGTVDTVRYLQTILSLSNYMITIQPCRALMGASDSGSGAGGSGGGCGPTPASKKVTVVQAVDPNDKVGTEGAGTARYVARDAPLPYTIAFENDANATAPAQDVSITDALDTTHLDLATLSLGAITFGDQRIVPPPGSTDFATVVDLGTQLVRVSAALNASTGVLEWRMTSIDPATGEPPSNPLVGFLPPDMTPPQGEGFVSFTVTPKPGLSTGVQISNSASITFDANAPVTTGTWVNTIDADPPTSQVSSNLTMHSACTTPVNVQWSGSDVGSGLTTYSIFVSVDGGPYTPWLTDTTATSAAYFRPWNGNTYGFYSVARDAAGNLETPPVAPDATLAVDDTVCGPHDLAIVKLKVPARVNLSANRLFRTMPIKVTVQNRSLHTESFPDLATLGKLITVTANPLAATTCPNPDVRVDAKKNSLAPLRSKLKRTVTFDATFNCAVNPLAGVPDYAVTATINHMVLGGTDVHAADDVCPRAATGLDPYPDGTIIDYSCGAKSVIDISVRP